MNFVNYFHNCMNVCARCKNVPSKVQSMPFDHNCMDVCARCKKCAFKSIQSMPFDQFFRHLPITITYAGDVGVIIFNFQNNQSVFFFFSKEMDSVVSKPRGHLKLGKDYKIWTGPSRLMSTVFFKQTSDTFKINGQQNSAFFWTTSPPPGRRARGKKRYSPGDRNKSNGMLLTPTNWSPNHSLHLFGGGF